MIRLCLATDNLDKVAMMIGFLMQTRLVKTRFKGCARTGYETGPVRQRGSGEGEDKKTKGGGARGK